MAFDKTPRVTTVPIVADREVVIRIEVVIEPDGFYMAHIEKASVHDEAHWGVSSDPEPTMMIALAEIISIGWINKELGP